MGSGWHPFRRKRRHWRKHRRGVRRKHSSSYGDLGTLRDAEDMRLAKTPLFGPDTSFFDDWSPLCRFGLEECSKLDWRGGDHCHGDFLKSLLDHWMC
jgi:hypothetical protein